MKQLKKSQETQQQEKRKLRDQERQKAKEDLQAKQQQQLENEEQDLEKEYVFTVHFLLCQLDFQFDLFFFFCFEVQSLD